MIDPIDLMKGGWFDVVHTSQDAYRQCSAEADMRMNFIICACCSSGISSSQANRLPTGKCCGLWSHVTNARAREVRLNASYGAKTDRSIFPRELSNFSFHVRYSPTRPPRPPERAFCLRAGYRASDCRHTTHQLRAA